jgi:hypothetical protein
MTTFLIALAATTYALGYATCARWLYRFWRPSTVLVRCIRCYSPPGRLFEKNCPDQGGTHQPECYMQVHGGQRTGCGTNGGAGTEAMITSLFWPIAMFALWMIRNPPELDIERQRREKQERDQLEAENARLDTELAKYRKDPKA